MHHFSKISMDFKLKSMNADGLNVSSFKREMSGSTSKVLLIKRIQARRKDNVSE